MVNKEIKEQNFLKKAVKKYPKTLLLLLTAAVMSWAFLHYVSNFSGMCKEEGRRLTEDEMVSRYLSVTYSDEDNKEAIEKTRKYFEKKERRVGKKQFYYKSLQHFLEINPFCCEVTDHTMELGSAFGSYDKFWDPLFGYYFFKLVVYNKNNRTYGRTKDGEYSYNIGYHALDSCGKVLRPYYEGDVKSEKNFRSAVDFVKQKRNGRPFKLIVK
jgi:hypothetical protein